jgi:hypothetical protein
MMGFENDAATTNFSTLRDWLTLLTVTRGNARATRASAAGNLKKRCQRL